ncbi:MAG: NAD(P)/FAD-dependent oxidoreductase [Gemmobacter sp.]|nr:NAD(P)/FAD-dependent oxidoreductase [Gemmobacter sp.]
MRTLVIGGGLSGLAVAHGLQGRGQDHTLVEARDRFGGRILTEPFGGAAFDLGPAWFWPGQPRIAALTDRLGLQRFDQYAQGDLIYEDAQGQVQRGRGFASMQGSWRLVGGLDALIQTLVQGLSPQDLRLNAAVTALAQTDAGIVATLATGDRLHADRVVLAMPPRLVADIRFLPALPGAATATLQSVTTWMAGQAKALAVYDRPFWRDAGLSGDATSRRGPMVEVHDASPATGGPFALFGFIGVPPEGRSDVPALRHHLIAQLVRMFGPQAATPAQLFVKDWATDPFTATQADRKPVHAHPAYGMPRPLTALWGGTLILAGTEVAAEFGGYLEGALESAEAALLTMRV